MKKLMAVLILCMAQTTMAFDKDDSFADLRDALMQSNKDYNDSKKGSLQEDNRRIASWNNQEQTTIVITSDIKTETEQGFKPLN